MPSRERHKPFQQPRDPGRRIARVAPRTPAASRVVEGGRQAEAGSAPRDNAALVDQVPYAAMKGARVDLLVPAGLVAGGARAGRAVSAWRKSSHAPSAAAAPAASCRPRPASDSDKRSRPVPAGFIGGAVPRAAVGVDEEGRVDSLVASSMVTTTSTAVPRARRGQPAAAIRSQGAASARVAPRTPAASRVGITMLRTGGTGRTMAASLCSVNPAGRAPRDNA